jgi:uncharacterized protein YbjT (DUF2867 family)
MTVVVIGATGTIGREVADALAERHTVVRASALGPRQWTSQTLPASLRCFGQQAQMLSCVAPLAPH